MAGCEVSGFASDLNQITDGFDVDWQWLRRWTFPRFYGKFDMTCASCNTQQSYSPPGEGEPVSAFVEKYAAGFARSSF